MVIVSPSTWQPTFSSSPSKPPILSFTAIASSWLVALTYRTMWSSIFGDISLWLVSRRKSSSGPPWVYYDSLNWDLRTISLSLASMTIELPFISICSGRSCSPLNDYFKSWLSVLTLLGCCSGERTLLLCLLLSISLFGVDCRWRWSILRLNFEAAALVVVWEVGVTTLDKT